MEECVEDKLVDVYIRYRKLIKELENTTDQKQISQIKHDIANVTMIIDFYEAKIN